MQSEKLHFRISSGLKNIIGRELINDKNIAIFELVKNSYDANAHQVRISFENLDNDIASITVTDDGIGMNKDDIISKWLFVAYSEKRTKSYRDRIKRSVAGAKGVGRFSCDRLGENVKLISKTQEDVAAHVITIDWNEFEKNANDNFADIDVDYSVDNSIASRAGTSIIITRLREPWTRHDFIQLRKALTQLVNPSSTHEYDAFSIYLDVPSEIFGDQNIENENDQVNGYIKNNVFQILYKKTTKITVEISKDGQSITTSLDDRGMQLFQTIEKNEYSLHDISATLFFLNRAAKINFTKIMGIEAKNYGSIFIYRNGFRVYPYGEPNRDFWGIDLRKAQGYKRYFGTREIIGQIEILNDYDDFVETSSRNNGFIENSNIQELKDFFFEYVLKPLEKYVTTVIQWGIRDSFLDSAKDNNEFRDILSIIQKIKTKSKDVNYYAIDYNKELPEIIDAYKNEIATPIDDLHAYAIASNNDELLRRAEEIKKHTASLERKTVDAQQEAIETHRTLESISSELNTTKKQVNLLSARANLSAQEAIDAMHIMKGYTDSISSCVSEIDEITYINRDNPIIKNISIQLYEIKQTCKKMANCYNLVVQTPYSASSDQTCVDIYQFLNDYTAIISPSIKIEVNTKSKTTLAIINPLELSVVIDNIISNSLKANARTIQFIIDATPSYLIVKCTDDGYGLRTHTDGSRIFEAGYSTTSGTGIGLSTVRKYIEEVGGKVEFNPERTQGFELILYFQHGHDI